MSIQSALQEYGLSEKEIEVYLSLLKRGSSTLQQVSKSLDFPRTTVYNTINYLVEKGLVSFISKKGVRHYEAADPQRLLDKIKEKELILKSVLPELKSLKEFVKQDSSVEIYAGTKGLFTILSDIFKVRQTVCYFGSYSLSKEILKHQPEFFRTIRLEKKIPARIVMDSYDEATFHRSEYKKITQMRFLPLMKDFPCMIFVYGKKVALYTLKRELVGIIIDNEQVAQAMMIVFETYWKSAKLAKL